MAKKTEGADQPIGRLPFTRVGGANARESTSVAEGPTVLDALALVDLCRLLDVPVGVAVAEVTASGGMAPDGDADRVLKRQLLELNRAFTRIPSPSVRNTLLQLVKAAAR